MTATEQIGLSTPGIFRLEWHEDSRRGSREVTGSEVLRLGFRPSLHSGLAFRGAGINGFIGGGRGPYTVECHWPIGHASRSQWIAGGTMAEALDLALAAIGRAEAAGPDGLPGMDDLWPET